MSDNGQLKMLLSLAQAVANNLPTSVLRNALNNRAMCVYDMHWAKCQNHVEYVSDQLCSEHSQKQCWCGNQAFRCCYLAVGPLVCGSPLCSDHECMQTSSIIDDGGFHSKRGYEQYREWQKSRPPYEHIHHVRPSAVFKLRSGSEVVITGVKFVNGGLASVNWRVRGDSEFRYGDLGDVFLRDIESRVID